MRPEKGSAFGLQSNVYSKMNRMVDTRPWGFRDYVRSHGFHTIYLVKSIRGRPIKVGVAEDPERRLFARDATAWPRLLIRARSATSRLDPRRR